jgi:hypothetical protein
MSKTDYNKAIPVFRLNPTNNNSSRIKYVGCFTDKEKLLDEKLDLDLTEDSEYYNTEHGKNTLYLGKVRGYDVTVELYKCNLTGSFVIENTEYPLFYFNVCYKNKFIRGVLMEYYFTFTMTEECKKELDDPKKYNGAEVNGTYTYGLSVNEKISENYKELLRELFKDDDIDVNQYSYLFEKTNYVDEYVTLTKVKKHMLERCCDKKMLDIINIAIKMREKERREDAGIDSDDEFKAPDPEKVIVLSNKEKVRERYKDLLSL